MGFNILIADDKGDDLDKAVKIISSSLVADYIDEVYTCQYIKTKFNCPPSEKTFLEIIESIPDLHFAFVDLSWDDHGDLSNYSDGGKFIIQRIMSRSFQNCLIIPLTKEIGENIAPSDQTFNYRSDSIEILFEAISKKATFDQQVERFNNLYISKWLLPFLGKINNQKYLNRILDAISKDQEVIPYKINNRTWDLGKLIADIPEERNKVIDHLHKCLNFTFPSGIFQWANPEKQGGGRPSKSGFKKPKPIDLVEVYKHYISIDKENDFEKTKCIDATAEDILRNRIKHLTSDNKEISPSDISISKVEIYNLYNEIPEAYYNLLIWRRVILGWIKHAERNDLHENKDVECIFEKCIGRKYNEVSYSTFNNTFFFLGFHRISSGSSVFVNPISLIPDNCFPEENKWLSKFQF